MLSMLFMYIRSISNILSMNEEDNDLSLGLALTSFSLCHFKGKKKRINKLIDK